MVFGLIMRLKLLCIMHLALYLFRKLPMNFSDEALVFLTQLVLFYYL
jgi:hypothetical protein